MENKIKIVLATSNPNKVKEMNEIAKNSNVEFILPECEKFDPFENGKTFIENARIKALYASKISGGDLFLADDSGLCVDFLNGEPGIYSARYEKTPELRIKKLLENMKTAENRKANFVCALCLVNKKGEILNEVEGKVFGKISYSKSGKGGFGYDPIFIVDNLNKTMAELSENEKNNISHRGQALKHMIEWIGNYNQV